MIETEEEEDHQWVTDVEVHLLSEETMKSKESSEKVCASHAKARVISLRTVLRMPNREAEEVHLKDTRIITTTTDQFMHLVNYYLQFNQ